MWNFELKPRTQRFKYTVIMSKIFSEGFVNCFVFLESNHEFEIPPITSDPQYPGA